MGSSTSTPPLASGADAQWRGFASFSQPAVVASFGVGPVNLRWIMVHMIDETARHAGHLDVLGDALSAAGDSASREAGTPAVGDRLEGSGTDGASG